MLLCLLHYCQGLSCHMNARVGPISPGKHAVPYSDLPVNISPPPAHDTATATFQILISLLTLTHSVPHTRQHT